MTTATRVLVDGEATGRLSTSDRGFQFGDGLFETIAVKHGRPCHWQAHLDRLAVGCHRLGLPVPDSRRIEGEVAELCRQQVDGVLKIYWTAGDSARGYRRPARVAPRLVVQLADWPTRPEGNWTIGLCSHRWSENTALAGIKHLNRLDQVLASSELQETDCEEGLMLAQDGRVVSGTMSNLFVQRGSGLATPAIDTAGIRGVTRGLVMSIAAAIGRPVTEARIEPGDLAKADVLYLCNSVIGVIRVGTFDKHCFDPGFDEHPAITRGRERCYCEDMERAP
jgi:4-amino-4-deoxychorismate lyase